MKVFMLIKWLHNSGAPKMFMWLANVLANQEHEVMVCTYQNQYAGNLSPSIKHIDFTNEQLGFCGKIKRIRQIIRDFDADVSISFLLDANVYNTFACYGLRTKSVICERNDPFKPGYYKLKFWKPWFRLSDGAVFQLPKVAEYYSMIQGSTAVIPNPVVSVAENVELKPFKERENVIVSLGRLDIFQKRQDILIKAFARFLEEHSDYTLKLYGDGPDEERLKILAGDLSISDKVVFCGITNHSLHVLSKAKFFVLTSDFEGIPNALLEAMSIGLPCISTKCRPGGAELLIQDGENGLLVDTDDVDAMCAAMQKMTEPSVADALGHEAKEIKNRFSEDAIASMWCDYLKQFRECLI